VAVFLHKDSLLPTYLVLADPYVLQIHVVTGRGPVVPALDRDLADGVAWLGAVALLTQFLCSAGRVSASPGSVVNLEICAHGIDLLFGGIRTVFKRLTLAPGKGKRDRPPLFLSIWLSNSEKRAAPDRMDCLSLSSAQMMK
jgi:hypothetical protein